MDWPRHKLSSAHTPTSQTKKSIFTSPEQRQAFLQYVSKNNVWFCGGAAKAMEEYLKSGESEFI